MKKLSLLSAGFPVGWFVLMAALPWSGVVAQQPDSAPATARLGNEVRQALDARIEKLKSDDKAYQMAMLEGQSRTALCKTCHGENGKSVKEKVPNLAGQNAAYLMDQFQRFRDGHRNDFLMSNLAKTFSDDDMLQISVYYASLPEVSFGGGKTDLIPEGRRLYAEKCANCHGENGRSSEGYARLAGQRPDYVVKIMKDFKTRNGARQNDWMTTIAMGLNNREIEALAAYLANM